VAFGKNRNEIRSAKIFGQRTPGLECNAVGIEFPEGEAQWFEEVIKIEKQKMPKDINMTILELNGGNSSISQTGSKPFKTRCSASSTSILRKSIWSMAYSAR
jgi:hypothetical protein